MGITEFKISIWEGIVGYMVINHVLQLRSCYAVNLNFRPIIRQFSSPNENFEYSYPLIPSFSIDPSPYLAQRFLENILPFPLLCLKMPEAKQESYFHLPAILLVLLIFWRESQNKILI